MVSLYCLYLLFEINYISAYKQKTNLCEFIGISKPISVVINSQSDLFNVQIDWSLTLHTNASFCGEMEI